MHLLGTSSLLNSIHLVLWRRPGSHYLFQALFCRHDYGMQHPQFFNTIVDKHWSSKVKIHVPVPGGGTKCTLISQVRDDWSWWQYDIEWVSLLMELHLRNYKIHLGRNWEVRMRKSWGTYAIMQAGWIHVHGVYSWVGSKFTRCCFVVSSSRIQLEHLYHCRWGSWMLDSSWFTSDRVVTPAILCSIAPKEWSVITVLGGTSMSSFADSWSLGLLICCIIKHLEHLPRGWEIDSTLTLHVWQAL